MQRHLNKMIVIFAVGLLISLSLLQPEAFTEDLEVWDGQGRIGTTKVKRKKSKAAAKIDPYSAGKQVVPSSTKTRLRVSRPRWVMSGDILVSGTANIKNVGDFPAKDVSVWVELPNVNKLLMKGPSTIGAHESAQFSVSMEIKVLGKVRPKVRTRCENCL